MKHGQAIQIDGEWYAVITYRDTGESYRLRCRDQEHAESVVLRETH
ncbi:hypothetical protein BLA18628_03318 [Burkholderia aenigmatica]|nr:hypothetical protein [Burkholderia aenigmatica]VWD12702.1 hypothetical protein BLA18628_03318 [Burkholderia aenigmatica]